MIVNKTAALRQPQVMSPCIFMGIKLTCLSVVVLPSDQSHTISTTRFIKGIMIKVNSTILFTITLSAVFILILKVAYHFTLFYLFAWSNRIRKRTVRGEICTGKTLMTRAGIEPGTFGTTHVRKRRSSQLRIKLA